MVCVGVVWLLVGSRHKVRHRDLHQVRVDMRISASSPRASAPSFASYPLHVVVGVGEVKWAVIGFSRLRLLGRL